MHVVLICGVWIENWYDFKSVHVDIRTGDTLPFSKYIAKVMKLKKKQTHKYDLPIRALKQPAADSITVLFHSLFDALLFKDFPLDGGKQQWVQRGSNGSMFLGK